MTSLWLDRPLVAGHRPAPGRRRRPGRRRGPDRAYHRPAAGAVRSAGRRRRGSPRRRRDHRQHHRQAVPAPGHQAVADAAAPVEVRGRGVRRGQPRRTAVAAPVLRRPRRTGADARCRHLRLDDIRDRRRAERARRSPDRGPRRALGRPARRPVPVPRRHAAARPGPVRPDGRARRAGRRAAAPTADRCTRAGGSWSVSKHGRPRATLDDGSTVEAENVVLATGTPILDRGLYFAKVEPLRSYALAFDIPDVPDGMFLSAGSPVRSIRDAPGRSASLDDCWSAATATLSAGRYSELEHLDDLRAWTALHFPGAVETHAWSAQDYRSHDGIPYVGHLPRGGGHIHLATGFDKWGMTNGVAAARNITARDPRREAVLGAAAGPTGHPSARRLQHRADERRSRPGRGALAPRRRPRRRSRHLPPRARASSADRASLPTGVSTVDGRTCAVAAICTHLGGVLSWNDAEKTWDCPLHGSRFAPGRRRPRGPGHEAAYMFVDVGAIQRGDV